MPEFLHALFNLAEKHSPVSFLAEMLLFSFVTFIVHASIFCLPFSQKQSANQPKNTGECSATNIIEKHTQRFRHF